MQSRTSRFAFSAFAVACDTASAELQAQADRAAQAACLARTDDQRRGRAVPTDDSERNASIGLGVHRGSGYVGDQPRSGGPVVVTGFAEIESADGRPWPGY